MDRITITGEHGGVTRTVYLSAEDLADLAAAVAAATDAPGNLSETRFGKVTVSKFPIPRHGSPLRRSRQP